MPDTEIKATRRKSRTERELEKGVLLLPCRGMISIISMISFYGRLGGGGEDIINKKKHGFRALCLQVNFYWLKRQPA